MQRMCDVLDLSVFSFQTSASLDCDLGRIAQSIQALPIHRKDTGFCYFIQVPFRNQLC